MGAKMLGDFSNSQKIESRIAPFRSVPYQENVSGHQSRSSLSYNDIFEAQSRKS